MGGSGGHHDKTSHAKRNRTLKGSMQITVIQIVNNYILNEQKS